jgi:hypothetical protein
MRVFVDAVGVLAPGLPNWDAARAVLAGQRPYQAAPLAPPSPASLPPAERRRSSPTVRLALAAAEQALQHTAIPAADLGMVFSSAEASGVITHQLCEVLAGTREVSPTQFHNSVHNAPSGYYSIALGARRGADSLCHGPWSFAAGLLDAAVRVVADESPVMYVCYDSPLPPPLHVHLPVPDGTAVALVLTPQNGAASLGAWEIDLCPGATCDAWPRWMPVSWQASASALGLAALATLAVPEGSAAEVILPLSPQLGLKVRRC